MNNSQNKQFSVSQQGPSNSRKRHANSASNNGPFSSPSPYEKNIRNFPTPNSPFPL